MTSPTGACAQCSAPAMMWCTACSNAPAYEECVSKYTFYCNVECQRGHRRSHKPECRKLQNRKAVRRAALLLQEIFYRIRGHAYPFQVTSTHTESSTLYLEISQYPGPDTHLGPLDKSLDADREAILAYMGCTEAMAYLHIFVKILLDGKLPKLYIYLIIMATESFCSKIEEVNVSITTPKRIIRLALRGGTQPSPPVALFHNIYRITLKNGEMWAIDVTGAQYGYAGPLRPWREFEQQEVIKINRECELGYMGRYCQGPILGVCQLEKQELRQLIEARAPEWSQDCRALLRGSDSASQSATNKFLEQFEKHVEISMTGLFSPERVARRSRDFRRELSSNIHDPHRQKHLAGLIEFMNVAMNGGSGSRS